VDAEREHLLLSVFAVCADAVSDLVGGLIGWLGDVRDDLVALRDRAPAVLTRP
jgi:hypothetical protein